MATWQNSSARYYAKKHNLSAIVYNPDKAQEIMFTEQHKSFFLWLNSAARVNNKKYSSKREQCKIHMGNRYWGINFGKAANLSYSSLEDRTAISRFKPTSFLSGVG